MPARILVIEDDDQLGTQIVGHLSDAGFEVEWLRDGDAARAVSVSEFALVVLDLMLPGTYGMDLLKRFRAHSDVPVLILSARDDTADKVRALKLGADDYMTKPFWPSELVARVQARLRRPDMRAAGGSLRVGALAIDVAQRAVEIDGASAPELTRVEFDILAALARRPGAAWTRRGLVEAVLDPERQGSERTLDVHVSRLRKKLGPAGGQLQTVWGIGYRLTPHGAEDS